MDHNLGQKDKIRTVEERFGRLVTRVHHMPPSREASPVRHPISPREMMYVKNELTPKLIIFMCGLPARGKSYVCKKLKRYLNWIGYKTEVFNVGNRRRMSTAQPLAEDVLVPETTAKLHLNETGGEPSQHRTSHAHEFFDPDNFHAKTQRDRWALDVLRQMINWLGDGGHVAIHDATNSTVARRRLLRSELQRLTVGLNIHHIFIESICTDAEIIQANIKMKTMSPDYAHLSPEIAIVDFTKRMQNYERAYETIGEQEKNDSLSYLKIINVGREVVSHCVQGYLESQIVFYLMNIHIKPRDIWLTSHGLSNQFEEDSTRKLIRSGKIYASALGQFIAAQYTEDSQMEVWTSMLNRSIEMAEYFPSHYTFKHSLLLNELYPGEFNKFMIDDYHASLFIERLRPLLIEMERTDHHLTIIARDIVLGALIGYFFDVPPREAFRLRVPVHTAVCLKPKPFGTEVVLFEFNEAEQTFRERVGSWKEILARHDV